MTTPKEALELKPCPFCGGEAESDSQRGYRNMTTGRLEDAAAIYCTACSADMTWCYRDTPEIERDQVMSILVEQWNKRALSDEAARADEVKDIYLVGGADLKAMSGDIDSNRVIKLHFRRRVTDMDREWLLDAINLKIKADQDAAAIRSNGRGA